MNVEDFEMRALTWKTGWLIFGISWFLSFTGVTLLRSFLIPPKEQKCYKIVDNLQKAVNHWNQLHPSEKMINKINENQLISAGLFHPIKYNHSKYFFFIQKTPWGRKVMCNRYQQNPLLLRLTGVTLLACIIFFFLCYYLGYVFYKPDDQILKEHQ